MAGKERWCAVVRTNDKVEPVMPDEVAHGETYKVFDTEFEARCVAAAYKGRFGMMRPRRGNTTLGPEHFFRMIEDYRWS